MKKYISLILLLSISIMCFSQKQFVVDPNATLRNISGSFNSIMVSGGIDLYLSQADDEAVAVSASDEKYMAGIKTIVSNNILKIYYEGEKPWGNKGKQLRVYVSFKNLEKLDASGASDIMVAGSITGESLLLKLSGASDFKGTVTLSSLKLDLSGASDVTINGNATVVNIESSGASDVKGYDLSTDVCVAKASGASDINITVTKELTAHTSGASHLYYKGDAVIKDLQSSGASDVSRKN